MAENRELALVLKLVADQFQSELRKSQGSLSSFNNFIKDWKTQLTAAGAALFAIAKSTANFGEEALKGAQKAGQTVETFTALAYAARLADVDQQQLIVGLKTLSQNMVEASRQTGDGAALFRRLGISALDAAGKVRPTAEVLLDLAEVFEQSADGAGKTEAAVKLFGKSGIELIPFLNQGKTGIAELMEEAKRLGVVLSTEDAEAANRFNDELKKLQASMRGLTLEAGKPLVAVLTELLETFRALTSSEGAQFFFKGLAEQVVLFSTLVKEAAANVQFLFGKLTFDQLKTEIKRLEADASAKLLLLENPAAAAVLKGAASGGGGAGAPKPEIAAVADQEKLAKALLEIFQEQQRAIEIRNQLVREGTIDEYLLRLDREAQLKQIDDDAEEEKGRRIVERTQLEVAIRDAALASEREGLITNLQAWVRFDEQVGASTALRLEHQLALSAATAAKELAVAGLTAQQKETIELESLTRIAAANEKASEDMIAGWAHGMDRYVRDTKSGFGLAADLARRTAQAMEQGFKQFFFDVFDGKVKSLKDVLMGVLDFVKQIAAHILASIATNAALKGLGYGANAGGQVLQRFAGGGPVLGTGNRDTVPALLTPGEWVLSRQDVSAIRSGAAGGGVSVVVNNYGNNEVKTSSGRGQDGRQVIYVTVRDMVRGMISGGEMDTPLAHRFGMSPGGG